MNYIQIAHEMNKNKTNKSYTADSVRMQLKRFLNKIIIIKIILKNFKLFNSKRNFSNIFVNKVKKITNKDKTIILDNNILYLLRSLKILSKIIKFDNKIKLFNDATTTSCIILLENKNKNLVRQLRINQNANVFYYAQYLMYKNSYCHRI